MFTDETMIKQFYAWSSHVRRPQGKRYEQRHTTPRVKNSPSVMIWGSISSQGTGGLWLMPINTTINAAAYLSMLKEKLSVFMQLHNFQQDGAPCHTARVVKRLFEEQDIQLICPWPGSSPDLNPIENCWAVLTTKKVSALKPTSHQDLVIQLKECGAWKSPLNTALNLWLQCQTESMQC